jgi:MFS family permease
MPLNLAFALALCFFVNLAATRVLLSLYALHLGAQAYSVGLVLAMFYAFPVLLSWPVGMLSDRFGSRWLLLFGAVGTALGLLIPFFVRHMAAIYLAAVLSGLALAAYHVTLQNLIGALSTPQQRTRSFANLSLIASSANFLGPLITGFSIDYSGHAFACVVVAAPAAVAAALLVLWGVMFPRGSLATAATASMLDTLADREIWRTLATSGLVQMGMDLFQFYMPILGHEIGLSASVIGMVLSAFALAAFVARLLMPGLVARAGEEALLSYSFYLAALAFLLTPFFKDALALALIAFVFGLGIGCSGPLTMILMFNQSAEGRSGEALEIGRASCRERVY